MSPWVWATGALIGALAELMVPGFYLIWIAAGAAITALAVFAFGVALPAQIIIFVLASLLTCGIGYVAYQRLIGTPTDQPALNERGAAMVGATGVVSEALKSGRGKVDLGDGVWLAEGPDLEEGAPVTVIEVRGTVLIVARR